MIFVCCLFRVRNSHVLLDKAHIKKTWKEARRIQTMSDHESFISNVRFCNCSNAWNCMKTILKSWRVNSQKPVLVYGFFFSDELPHSLFADFLSIAHLDESKSFFIFSWIGSCEMKQNVCTPFLAFKSAGITLIVLGAFLAIFWPNIFEYLLARVGHDLITHTKSILNNKHIISRSLHLVPHQKLSNNGRNQVCRST